MLAVAPVGVGVGGWSHQGALGRGRGGVQTLLKDKILAGQRQHASRPWNQYLTSFQLGSAVSL